MKKRKLKENVVVALHVTRIISALVQGASAVFMVWLLCKCNLNDLVSWSDVGMMFAGLAMYIFGQIVGNAVYELLVKYE